MIWWFAIAAPSLSSFSSLAVVTPAGSCVLAARGWDCCAWFAIEMLFLELFLALFTKACPWLEELLAAAFLAAARAAILFAVCTILDVEGSPATFSFSFLPLVYWLPEVIESEAM